jgi:drug/metabolite transporter (DMT)-like permease
MVIALALLAAGVYGAADFLGGLASRRTPATAVVVISQIAGVAVLAIAWFVLPGKFYPSDVLWGMLTGLFGGAAIVSLYAALAIGRMGVISPITAVLGASVPVLAGFALGERPAAPALAGIACTFLAVALVSANVETRSISLHEPGLGLALFSGLCIGALFVTLSRGHHDSGLALLAVTRATSVVSLIGYALVRRESLRPAPGSLRLIFAAGAFDMLANVLYIAAARFGLLSLVAVLTSLYPASTVFLARVVLQERLTPSQWAGVGLAACGIGLIAL